MLFIYVLKSFISVGKRNHIALFAKRSFYMHLSTSLDSSQVFQIINEEPVSITCLDVDKPRGTTELPLNVTELTLLNDALWMTFTHSMSLPCS